MRQNEKYKCRFLSIVKKSGSRLIANSTSTPKLPNDFPDMSTVPKYLCGQ